MFDPFFVFLDLIIYFNWRGELAVNYFIEEQKCGYLIMSQLTERIASLEEQLADRPVKSDLVDQGVFVEKVTLFFAFFVSSLLKTMQSVLHDPELTSYILSSQF